MSDGITRDWTVNAVREGDVVPNPHGGELQKFYVDFEGSGDTYWRRKAGDVPEVGRSYYGNIRQGDYGPMFKKMKPEDGAARSNGSRSSGGGGFPPDVQAAITRQHSQEMAIRALALGGLGRDSLEDWDEAKGAIREWTDWFQADVDAAAEAAQGNGDTATLGGESGATAGSSPAQTLEVSLTEIEQALDVAGLRNSQALSKVSSYMLSELAPERVVSAVKGLTNGADSAGVEQTLAALVKLTERKLGTTLPTAPDSDESIPF